MPVFEPLSHADLRERIKSDLLDGRLARDQRIDLQQLADRFRLSVTPIRDVLFELTGERLIEPHRAGGFQPLTPSARQLRDLYDWNLHHLLAAIHLLPDPIMRKVVKPFTNRIGAASVDAADEAARLFLTIGAATGNAEFATQIARANDRLHQARQVEGRLFQDRVRELASIVKSNGFDVRKNVRRRVSAYHRRRAERSAQIAALLP